MTLAVILLGAMAIPPPDTIDTIDTIDTEDLFANVDESNDEVARVIERLEELRRRPLDLNHCSADDLLELPFVSPAEASAVVDHRRANGRFASTAELRNVTGLDPATIERLLHFVELRPPVAQRLRPPLRAELTQRWTRRLERADGFRRDSSGYLGDPNVLQMRGNVSFTKLSAGVTLDKDAGEPIDWNARKRSLGYDFVAGYVQVQDLGWVRRLVLGDFSPRFAHGVLLRAPGSFRSSAPSGRGGAASLRPYASSGESGYFRGAGIQLEPAERIGVTAFVSRRRLDAGVDTTGGLEHAVFSRRSSGLHRTTAERAGRGILQESSFGGALRTTAGPVSVSAAIYASEEVVTSPFTGGVLIRKRTSTYSLSAGARIGAVYAAAEFAPAAGFSATMEVQSGRAGRVGVAVRRSLNAIYLPNSALAAGSDGFTDGTTQVVVHGRHHLSTATNVEFKLEHEHRRAPANRTPFATVRSYADARISHAPVPWLTLSIRGTSRRSDDVRSCVNGAVRCLAPATRQTLRFQFDYRHSRHLECRIRGEYVRAHTKDHAPSSADSSRGLLVYQELRLRPSDALRIAGRLAVFSADRHSARIYTYENDLTYAFSSPSFAGRGRRAYILVQWRSTRAVTFETKWSQTALDDVSSIGSGRDEVRGSKLREIRIQIRVRFR